MFFKAHATCVRWFRVRVVMPDGSQGRFVDRFASGFDAIERTQSHFPDAKRVSALYLGASA